MELLFDNGLNYNIRFAKLYYELGYKQLENNPFRSEALWEASTKLDPLLSYYYVELASLKMHLQQTDDAKKTLLACRQIIYASGHCATFTVDTLLPAGSFKKKIISDKAQ
jgi:hypothetical protein